MALETTPPEKIDWSVDFANGVAEVCVIRKDQSISVIEPRRSSGGRASNCNGSAVIVCDDDRVVRWTAAGQRMVVEHWLPAAQFPAGRRSSAMPSG